MGNPKKEGDDSKLAAGSEEKGVKAQSEAGTSARNPGGFDRAELRTIPANATSLQANVGDDSRRVDILANYVWLKPMPDKIIHSYRIDFEPQVESQSTMRFLFRTVADQVFVSKPIYDGMHECRIAQQLAERVTRVTVADQRAENREYTVVITHTGQASFGAESLRMYNMQMKEFLRMLGYYSPQVGIYVHPNLSTPVGPELMMMRGWRTAANIHDGGHLLMNLEGAHKLIQKSNVLAMMSAVRNRGGNFKAALEAFLVGKVVVTSYQPRVYKIESIEYDTNPTSTFDRNGTPITFVDYYRDVHRISIHDLKQPLLRCVPNDKRRRDETGKTLLLVPELCNITGMTEEQRSNNYLKQDLIRASQVPPNERVEHMKTFLEQFHGHEEIKSRLGAWGYSYADDLVKLKAHVIEPTRYATGPDLTKKPFAAWTSSNAASADININGLAVVPPIKKMVLITTRVDIPSKALIVKNLKDGFKRVGLVISNVTEIDIPDGDSPGHYIKNIRNIAPDVDLAIVIMNRQQKERYDAIKKVASVEKGLITQVVTARLMTDDRKARSAAVKIAIQVAAKVGGEPWWADIPLKSAMVCGYDTYHDTAQRGRSYGAFVASMNAHFSRWWSKADAHDRLEEISTQVAANMTEAVKQYRQVNNELPERVIIYRDGVGEGQLEHVFKVELRNIKSALEAIAGDKKILLTMIIVSKRIGARFYMRASQGLANPPPGTVVDHAVTRQERFDFYLISQSTRHGTVTPTYYNIIYDESCFLPIVHQKMAYKFCLLYYNWAGTVRVPAPCQYAHKLALLCGEHLHAQPNKTLDDKLHFL